MKQLQKKIKSGTLDLNKDDPFELFISSTNIRYCYYNETHKILGNTYGMCILQVRPIITLLLLHLLYGIYHEALWCILWARKKSPDFTPCVGFCPIALCTILDHLLTSVFYKH